MGEADYNNSLDSSTGCPTGRCVLSAALHQFFGIASLIWSTCFCSYVHDIFLGRGGVRARGRGGQDGQRRLWRRYHLATWGGASGLLIAVLAARGLGAAGNW